MSHSVFKKSFILLILVAFVLVAIVGLYQFTLHTGVSGHMSGCPFSNVESFCGMNATEHVALWQIMFAGSLKEKLIQLLGLTFILILFSHRHIFKNANLLIHNVFKLRLRVFDFGYREVMKEALSQGILNPKLHY